MKDHILELIERYPDLGILKEQILLAYELLQETYSSGHKVIAAGNGGSAADAEHIVGELMKGFRLPRPIDTDFENVLITVDEFRGAKLAQHIQKSLPALALVGNGSLSTAIVNDMPDDMIFAQQLYGYGRRGDLFLAISTSGKSTNIINAVIVAKALGMKTIGLTGGDGGELSNYTDIAVCVPEKETYKIQELHLPIYHWWCMMLEEHFFGNSGL